MHGASLGQKIIQAIFPVGHHHVVGQNLTIFRFRELQFIRLNARIGLLRHRVLQNLFRQLVDLLGCLVGSEAVIDFQTISLFHGRLPGRNQFLGGWVQQRHQIASVGQPHIFISRRDNTRYVGNFKFMYHVDGGLAVCNLITAERSKVLRKIDQAITAVNVTGFPIQPDAEHSILFPQNTIGCARIHGSHRFCPS